VKEALFFDLDGTLLFTEKANFLAYNSALGEFGKQIKRQEFGLINGRDSREFLSKIFPDLSENYIHEIRVLKQTRYSQYFSEVARNEYLIELIKANPEKTISLVTNGKSKNTFEIIKYFDLEKLFNYVITGDDVSIGKPDSAIYLKALQVNGIESFKALAFEDSPEGVISARGAGIEVIRVPRLKQNS
jgi:beta-phosphoglucomutase